MTGMQFDDIRAGATLFVSPGQFRLICNQLTFRVLYPSSPWATCAGKITEAVSPDTVITEPEQRYAGVQTHRPGASP